LYFSPARIVADGLNVFGVPSGIILLRQFDEDELQVAQQVLESLILKHQAKQMVLRTQHPPSATTEKKRAASGRRR
jgi:hypothetical protein